MNFLKSHRRTLTAGLVALAALFGGAGGALLGVCGPFTDVSDATFCPFVLEIFTLGITTGTSPTTYAPAATVNRLQMAAFLSRTVDGVARRGSRRAALNQFWTTEGNAGLATTTVGNGPRAVVSDGEDVWLLNNASGTVSRVHASDGRLLDTWTGVNNPAGILSAMGRIFVSGYTFPGTLYRIDPGQAAGAVTAVTSNLGPGPSGIAYDGSRIWTVNNGSVSIITPGAAIPWTVTTVNPGFGPMSGALFDGANVWVTNQVAGTLLKLDAAGTVLQTVTTGGGAPSATFDGANIWVPSQTAGSVSVVRASNGAILSTLTGNGLNQPLTAAFDGQRVLVTNYGPGASSVSLWKAADLTPLGSFGVGSLASPWGACSDGINFWITLSTASSLARF